MNPWRAVVIGHLIVTIPVFLIIFGVLFVGLWIAPTVWFLFLGLGSLTAWLWWSFVIPRWREWAIARGAPPDKLQRIAAVTLLVWPKGSLFERTEFRRK